MKRPPGSARTQSTSSHHHHAQLSTSLATSPGPAGAILPSSPRKSSALPLPSLKLKHNRSFALLAQMIGIGSGSGSAKEEESGDDQGEDEEDGEGDEEALEDEVDEDTLLWDAQVSHQ